jgi:hypothetical protein
MPTDVTLWLIGRTPVDRSVGLEKIENSRPGVGFRNDEFVADLSQAPVKFEQCTGVNCALKPSSYCDA